MPLIMKGLKMWLIGIMIVLPFSSIAQYLGDKISLESYAGEWKWETDNESFTLYLRDTVWMWQSNDKEASHAIVGTYRYVKNGTVIIDNTGVCKSPADMPVFAMESPGHNDESGNVWALWVVVEDTNTRKLSDEEYSTLKYSLGRFGPLLTMSLTHTYPWFEGIEEQVAALTGEDPDELKAIVAGCRLSSFSFPEAVTFTKVVK